MTEYEEISMQKKRSIPKKSNDNEAGSDSVDINQTGLDLDHVYDIEERKNNSILNLDHNRTAISIKWDRLMYSVKVKDTKSTKKCCTPKIDKIILNNITGQAKPGELVAIMGPSGSGKTTLLNILSGRCVRTKGAKLSGYISVNDVDKNELGSEKFSQISAFVQQDDIMFAMQTVKETLMTSARLRLPKKMSMAEKEKRVDSIIQELGLKKAQHTYIGDARHRGISGGERKRANIGVEMIQDPSLLFLDEPTSGIDSFQALNVIETLKILCMSGVTIIVSVHQPRSSIYKLFDHLILLSEGCVAYDGPAGDHAVNYFTKIGLKCPPYFHPGDYFLDVISLDNRSKEQEIKSTKRIKYILESYQNYSKHQTIKHKKLSFEGSIKTLNLDHFSDGVHSSICEQLKILGLRNVQSIMRDKITLGIRIFFTCFFALFLSALWSDTGNDQKDIQNRNGILFFIAINQSFGGMMSTLQVFIIEKSIVMRERQAHSYYLWTYYLTKFFTQLPIEVLFPCIFAGIVYFIVGLNPDPMAFLIFLIITILVSVSAVAIGFLVGSCAPNMDAANAMAPLIMVLTILFGGFYINAEAMPDWIAWLENVSTIKWTFEAYCINEYTGLDDFTCNDLQPGEPCYTDPEQVLELLSFTTYTVWQCIIILAALFVGFHVIAFSCLKFVTARYLVCTPPTGDNMINVATILEQNHYGKDIDIQDLIVKSDANEAQIESTGDENTTKVKKPSIKTPLLTT